MTPVRLVILSVLLLLGAGPLVAHLTPDAPRFSEQPSDTDDGSCAFRGMSTTGCSRDLQDI